MENENNTDLAHWYVVYTYSGYENKVKVTLEKLVENRGMQDKIQEIIIPMEEEIEIKDGKQKTSIKKVFPGYVLIKMIMTDETWYIVKNIKGVFNFVGVGEKPLPLTEKEMQTLGIEDIMNLDFEVGDTVRIITEPFYNYTATIEEMNHAGNEGGKKGGNKNQNLDANSFDLYSKRTFKKVYKGINFKDGKIDYYTLFNDTVKNVVENSEEKIKILEKEYKKDNWSKNMTGIKLQNNKNLFSFRNEYYKKHCEQFNSDINEFINKYNSERLQELEYNQKWKDTMKNLKENLEQFNKKTGNIIQKETNEEVLKTDNSKSSKKKK